MFFTGDMPPDIAWVFVAIMFGPAVIVGGIMFYGALFNAHLVRSNDEEKVEKEKMS